VLKIATQFITTKICCKQGAKAYSCETEFSVPFSKAGQTMALNSVPHFPQNSVFMCHTRQNKKLWHHGYAGVYYSLWLDWISHSELDYSCFNQWTIITESLYQSRQSGTTSGGHLSKPWITSAMQLTLHYITLH